MSFVQNFPLFAIILSLVCAVISFAANDRWARRLTLFLLSVSVCMQAALLVFCAVNGTSYSYMMGHYPAPWGNEITVGVLESFMALLFAAVMLLSVLGGMPRIRRDIPEHRMRLYWVMIDLAHVALLALCYTNDIFTAYVFIEVLTIASCCLLAARDGGRPLLAAVRYMIFSLVGSGLFLIGVIFTYSITGQLLFPQLKESIALLWADGTYRFSMTVAIGLMVGGLAIKSGLFPFHFWMPDTYGRATPASAGILSGVVSKGSIFLLIKNAALLPSVFQRIFEEAFGIRQVVAGGFGAVLMQGVKRGLFSNEAGSGSAPCAAAAADVSHPAKAGLLQALGVFIDTIVICSCTAFIMLVTPAADIQGLEGMGLLQASMEYHLGQFGVIFIAVILWLFSFSTFIGILFYARSNVAYLFGDNWVSQTGYKILALIMLFVGGLATYTFVWDLGDVGIGLMTIFNILVILPMSKEALASLREYEQEIKERKRAQ